MRPASPQTRPQLGGDSGGEPDQLGHASFHLSETLLLCALALRWGNLRSLAE